MKNKVEIWLLVVLSIYAVLVTLVAQDQFIQKRHYQDKVQQAIKAYERCTDTIEKHLDNDGWHMHGVEK